MLFHTPLLIRHNSGFFDKRFDVVASYGSSAFLFPSLARFFFFFVSPLSRARSLARPLSDLFGFGFVAFVAVALSCDVILHSNPFSSSNFEPFLFLFLFFSLSLSLSISLSGLFSHWMPCLRFFLWFLFLFPGFSCFPSCQFFSMGILEKFVRIGHTSGLWAAVRQAGRQQFQGQTQACLWLKNRVWNFHSLLWVMFLQHGVYGSFIINIFLLRTRSIW